METTTEVNQYEEKNVYGGFWIRVAAYLIDSIIIGIPLTIISILILLLFFGTSDITYLMMADPAYMETGMTDEEALSFLATYFGSIIVTSIVSIVIAVAYFAGLQASKWQATIGKKALGLQVTDLKGERISFWRGFGRYLAMSFLSGILFIGYIMVGITEKKQGLHDFIAGTVVVKK
ncbi:RDD family protein [Niallia endozanthoxylica]|uniref:RDD family protein n=1 Tax=Niallia endozanthoxylica TaxID=2036016 RepID=A0A5J5HWM9_9BACI|nr:RDD family protein [Niallia endozanthoxylica]KAA9026048.1 RDD family protein [Niallia endozanthoxylica]